METRSQTAMNKGLMKRELGEKQRMSSVWTAGPKAAKVGLC